MMDERTRMAWLMSLSHWEANASAETLIDARIGRNACALCTLYWDDGCEGCPIAQKTGQTECSGTPYLETYKALARDDLPAFHKAAQSMVEFLRSLDYDNL